MTGRHRRLDAASEPTPRALAAAVTAAVDAAHAAVDDRAGFEGSVLTAFADVVWRLHNDQRMVRWRAEPEASLRGVAAASTAALPEVVDDVATRLDALAAASRVDLDDSESLAELLVRMAHALLLVPDPGPGGRAELDSYVQRYVAPVVRSAVDVEADGSSPTMPTRRRRRARAEMLVATLVAVLVGSAGWIAVVSGTAEPAVAPTNVTDTIPEPQQPAIAEVLPPRPVPTPSVTQQPAPPSDVPIRIAAEPSTRTPVRAAPPAARTPGESHGSSWPDGRPMGGPREGFPSLGGQPSGPTSTFGSPGGSARFPGGPSNQGSGPSGVGNPNAHPGGHPDGHD